MHHDTLGRDHIDPDVERQGHPDLVLLDVGIEPGCLVFLQNVLGGLAVFRRSGNVRRGGQDSQMLLRQLRVGHGQKCLLRFQLGPGSRYPKILSGGVNGAA